MASTFLSPSPITKAGDLASLHLRRDQSLPTILSTQVTTASEQGYAEGVVTNTRFGSFPHSTIIGAPWGSQIRASKVDTGTRGRVNPNSNAKKRKFNEANANAPIVGATVFGETVENKQAEAAESGFIHVLPPTPENWTTSLPHRTQVVYTPDYSYILHRIRARPGSRLIEAGSGSGSFTHAAARAVFSGYPKPEQGNQVDQGESEGRFPLEEKSKEPVHDDRLEADSRGRVFSYEYHRERHEKVKEEMIDHGLNWIVRAMHRDVYSNGFLVYDSESTSPEQKTSPHANAIFLDLPAPWEALPHLTRERGENGTPSVLDPDSAVHICTFSPCIEQVQKTVSALRRYDWIDIEAVEMQHKRIEVRREHTGLQYDGMRGANAFATDVDAAVAKLRNVEQRVKEYHAGNHTGNHSRAGKRKASNQQQQQQDAGIKLPFNEGRLVHRTEPDLKTHTSYLVFATLPRAWSEEEEAAAQEKWSKNIKISASAPKSQRQIKKEAKQKKGQRQDGIKSDVPRGVDTPMKIQQADRVSE